MDYLKLTKIDFIKSCGKLAGKIKISCKYCDQHYKY